MATWLAIAMKEGETATMQVILGQMKVDGPRLACSGNLTEFFTNLPHSSNDDQYPVVL
ncbi:hypothetical protein BDQ94DRAFT_165976 [Aspergillus welwitschiae]|uniref:Uncharacterized protein n=1 Tax=Aspergillus welwitschiae TaxID=1341132 RepID=A0A3F3QIE4_9EURO|nr:hypothetical protein BDQ94DRAFT_165976 [Aspergillus welwitschiae]RDH38897.1 hypothetical protein BDQ94DRAFT_165976 [Aspergillus welwitschiae]